METPSTRKVTATTVTPAGVLGVAVSTTIWLTVAGAVIVIEEPVVVVPDPELLDPELLVAPELLDPELLVVPELLDPELLVAPELLDDELLVDPELLDPELLVDPELLDDELLVVLALFAMLSVGAAAGIVVSPPQPARLTDSPVMTNRTIGREHISLSVSYISTSPK
jgi:hypothetical protein